jgi:hypothetical protein
MIYIDTQIFTTNEHLILLSLSLSLILSLNIFLFSLLLSLYCTVFVAKDEEKESCPKKLSILIIQIILLLRIVDD